MSKEIRVSIGSRSFLISVDKFEQNSTPGAERFRIVPLNSYFHQTIGDNVIIRNLHPQPDYSPKNNNIQDIEAHAQLMQAIYESLTSVPV